MEHAAAAAAVVVVTSVNAVRAGTTFSKWKMIKCAPVVAHKKKQSVHIRMEAGDAQNKCLSSHNQLHTCSCVYVRV